MDIIEKQSLTYEHFKKLSSEKVIKDIFIKPLMTSRTPDLSGFSINQLTVNFSHKKNKCQITFFDRSGKSCTNDFYFPISSHHLLELIFKSIPNGFEDIITRQIKIKWKPFFKKEG